MRELRKRNNKKDDKDPKKPLLIPMTFLLLIKLFSYKTQRNYLTDLLKVNLHCDLCLIFLEKNCWIGRKYGKDPTLSGVMGEDIVIVLIKSQGKGDTEVFGRKGF